MASIFSAPPKPPAITAPAPMPVSDDKAILAAKKKAQMAASTRTGRSSTILTDYGSAQDNKFG